MKMIQHMHLNACRNVWLGYITCGLLEKLPHDMMMYTFLHGVLMYVIEVIMSPLNPTENTSWILLLMKLLFQQDHQ